MSTSKHACFSTEPVTLTCKCGKAFETLNPRVAIRCPECRKSILKERAVLSAKKHREKAGGKAPA